MSGLDQKPRYELHRDQLEETYTIRKVQDIGPFDSREAARAWMLARPVDTQGAVEENVKLRDLCERAVDALRYEANPVCDEWDDWLATHPGTQ